MPFVRTIAIPVSRQSGSILTAIPSTILSSTRRSTIRIVKGYILCTLARLRSNSCLARFSERRAASPVGRALMVCDACQERKQPSFYSRKKLRKELVSIYPYSCKFPNRLPLVNVNSPWIEYIRFVIALQPVCNILFKRSVLRRYPDVGLVRTINVVKIN